MDYPFSDSNARFFQIWKRKAPELIRAYQAKDSRDCINDCETDQKLCFADRN